LKKIALICLTNIGDGVLLSPCISALKSECSNSYIVLIAKPSVCELYSHDKRISDFIRYTASWFPNYEKKDDGLFGFFKTIIALRKHKFQIALNTTSDLRTNILIKLSGIKNLIVLKSKGGEWLANTVISPASKNMHEADRLQLLAEEFFKKKIIKYPLKIEVSNKSRLEADSIFQQLRIKSMLVIAIHPGANAKFKEWPLDKFIDLGRKILINYNCRLLILGAQGREVKLAEEIVSNLGFKSINLAGKLSLDLLLAVLSKCSLFVGNDSGPMHLAAAAGCPTIGIFGATNYLRFGPYTPKINNNVIHPINFSFEEINDAQKIGSNCLESIPVERVYNRVCILLSKKRKSNENNI
jgi:heptosyltransferase-2